MQNNKKQVGLRGFLFTGLVLACAGAAQATEIAVDLGPPNNKVTTELRTAFGTEAFALDGRTMSVDFTFGAEFIHTFPSTWESFIVLPMLQLYGTGTITGILGSGYVMGTDGSQIGQTWDYIGGSVIADHETFNYALGYAFPLLYGQEPADIYGMHLEITLPSNADFTIVGGQFLFATNAYQSWHDTFAVGPHVPESGGTGLMLLSALGLIFILLACGCAGVVPLAPPIITIKYLSDAESQMLIEAAKPQARVEEI